MDVDLIRPSCKPVSMSEMGKLLGFGDGDLGSYAADLLKLIKHHTEYA